MALPTLYQLQASHACEAARWLLDTQASPYLIKSLLPGPHVAQLMALTRQTKVPALVHEGKVAAGFAALATAAQSYGAARPELRPTDAVLGELVRLDAALGTPLETVWLAAALTEPDYAANWLSLGRGPTRRFLYKQAFPAVRAALGQLFSLSNPRHLAACEASVVAGLDQLVELAERDAPFELHTLYAASCVSWLVPAPWGPLRMQEIAPPRVRALHAAWGAHPAVKWATAFYQAHRGASMAENHEVQGSGVI